MADDLDTRLPLNDFLAALRAEIRAAQQDADRELPIEIGSVTVEFTLLTRREAKAEAGVRFWVVEAGAAGTHASESTQKVRVELNPMAADGQSKARIRDVEPTRRTTNLSPGAY